MKPEFSFTQADEILLLAGVKIDIVREIGEVNDLRPGETVWGLDYTPDNVQRTWQRLAGIGEFRDALVDRVRGELTEEEEMAIYLSTGVYPTGIPNPQAYLRTVLCNPTAEIDGNYFNPAFGIDGERRWENRTVGPGGMDDEHLRARTGMACIDRRFCHFARIFWARTPGYGCWRHCLRLSWWEYTVLAEATRGLL
ncbi:hypothetical protein BU26DRAFT_524388 [Trematosphaeria pertusa]|uniref:Uncharacterized protein n=1 Tax=Trematosphaeria pertusa TaxID=390896 RepID=A0A6A6HVK4_9PLEO|nr:uncharacterized protein BU26DRAFT_524388 [Trematosphaeria pertusa]KAF2242195.1 hypothetical protein BU26DRAFT_524388 [Trematosphaeria pertusa]